MKIMERERDRQVFPHGDEPLDAEIALLISGIEKELAVVSLIADTLAARLRGIAGQERSKVGRIQPSRSSNQR
jgi:hypothetical protein